LKKPRSPQSPDPGAAPDTEAGLPFEEALARLETLVDRLEEGEIPLEESVRAYAEGMRLVRSCLARLEAAEATVRELAESAEGFDLRDRDAGFEDDA